MRLFLLLLSLLTLGAVPRAVAAPILSEFMASNATTLADEDGAQSDWIEIANPDAVPVNLAGWHLTDDAAAPLKWTFPAVTLPSGGRIVVFASGKNRTIASGTLHTNFSLKAEGEYLALTTPAGVAVTAFAPTFPPQVTDRSYGISSTGATGYFVTPTPGAANGAQTVAGFVEKVTFSAQRGFFSAPFALTLATDTPGAQIRYTTDGSTPTASHGTVYTAPLTLDRTTVLRASAFVAGWATVDVATRSFFFPADILAQSANGAPPPGWPTGPVNGQALDYGMDPNVVQSQPEAVKTALQAIPTISLVTDVPNLFDSATGIYVNPDDRGTAWERPVSVELMNHFAGGFHIDAGLRLRGGFSRATQNPKHSLRLHFRKQYGAGSLDYQLFRDEGPERFDGIDLATAQDYSWSYTDSDQYTMLRDPWLRDSMRDMRAAHTRSFFVHVYLNGQYWGVYYTEERPEAGFGENHYGGTKEDYDCIKSTGLSGGLLIETTDGTIDAWQSLWQQARAHATDPSDARYFKMQGLAADGLTRTADPVLLDPDALIDYLMTIYVSGCYDAPVTFVTNNQNPNNFFMLRNRQGDWGWKYFVHDGEQALDGPGQDRTGPFTTANQNFIQYSNPQFLHQDLIGNAEYRLRWADHVQKHFFGNGLFTREKCQSRLDRRAAELEPAVLGESARWGDAQREPPYGPAHWRAARDLARGFFDTRLPIVLAQLQEDGLFPTEPGPQILPSSGPVAEGGQFYLASTGAQIFYTVDGPDPRLPGGATHPQALEASGGVLSPLTFVPVGGTWRYLDNGTQPDEAWKQLDFDDTAWKTGQAEFGYGDFDEQTWVEDNPTPGFAFGETNRYLTHYFRNVFYVSDPGAMTTLELKLLVDDGAAVYLNGEEIARENMPPGDLNWVTTATAARVGDEETTFTPHAIDPARLHPGANILSVEVHQASTASNDMSFDLSLIGLSLDPSTGVEMSGPAVRRVKARARTGTTWSPLSEARFLVDAEPASAQNLAVSEVHFAPAGSRQEAFVELLNTGARAIDLAGVRLEGDVRHVFPPDGTPLLAPGARLVLAENASAFTERYGFAPGAVFTGQLSATAGTVTVRTAEEALIDTAGFATTPPWPVETTSLGHSLVRLRPEERLSGEAPTSWRLSTAPGGSPGGSDSVTYAAWKAENGVESDSDDPDGDGMNALLEYAFGGNPAVPDSGLAAALGTPAPAGTWPLAVPLRAGADDVVVTPQLSPNLATWSDAIVSAPVVSTADGKFRVQWTVTSPASPPAFWRLRVSLR